MITPRPDEQGHCDRCHDPVVWTVTVPNNARRPVNPEPNPAGSTAVYRDETGRLRSRQLTQERPRAEAAEQLYMTHHATCRNPAPRGTSRQGRRRPRPRSWISPGRTA